MRKLLALFCPFVFVILGGSGRGLNTALAPNPIVVASLVTGRASGGQQPANGAIVQLWQAGTAGYGASAATLGFSTTHRRLHPRRLM